MKEVYEPDLVIRGRQNEGKGKWGRREEKPHLRPWKPWTQPLEQATWSGTNNHFTFGS